MGQGGEAPQRGDESRRRSGVAATGEAQYYVARYQGKAGPQLRTLAEKTDKFSAADKSQLWYGLLICSRQVSDVPQARKMADLVAQASPGNVHIQIIRFQLAIAAHDYGALDAILTQIEKISGRARYGIMPRPPP